MAQMYPPRFPYANDPLRNAERRFFDACEHQLDDTWTVLFEQHWFGHRNGKYQSGEADFVMLNSSAGVFVVEVKGGQKIEVEDGDWYTIPHGKSARNRIKNPFTQAADSKFVLWQFIREKLPDVKLSGEIGHMVVLPGHRQIGDMSPQARRTLICDRDDLKSLSTTMQRVAAQFSQGAKWTDENLQKIVKLLTPTFRLIGSSRAVIDETLDELNRLTDEQLRAFSLLRNAERLKIYGTAGTGKTVLAYHRAKEIALSSRQTLLLCASIPLAQFLRSEWSREFGEDSSHLEIRAIEEFFQEYSIEVHLRLGKKVLPTYEDVLEYLISLPKEEIERFDALIVDEAQSIASKNIELIGLFLKPGAARYVFGDGVQALEMGSKNFHEYPLTSWLFGQELLGAFGIAGECLEVKLTTCCRSSRRISKFANSFTSNEIDVIGPKGLKVQTLAAPMSKWTESVASIAQEWHQNFGVEIADIRLLVDEEELTSLFSNGHGDEFEVTSVNGLPIGVGLSENLLIDWVPVAPIHRQLRFAALILRFRSFYEETDPDGRRRGRLEAMRLAKSSYGVWWAKKRRDAGFSSGTGQEYPEWESYWPITGELKQRFELREEILGSQELPVIRAYRSRDFAGLEAEAVIVVLTPTSNRSNFVRSAYSMLTRAKVLLAVICDEESLIQMASTNNSKTEKFRIFRELGSGSFREVEFSFNETLKKYVSPFK